MTFEQRLRRYRQKIVWRRKQSAAKQTGARYYGDGGTIHSTTNVNVEIDSSGNVVSCWFRCQMLPFDVTVVGDARADEMRQAFSQPLGELTGVEIRDPDTFYPKM
jgi:hypothetical protein